MNDCYKSDSINMNIACDDIYYGEESDIIKLEKKHPKYDCSKEDIELCNDFKNKFIVDKDLEDMKHLITGTKEMQIMGKFLEEKIECFLNNSNRSLTMFTKDTNIEILDI